VCTAPAFAILHWVVCYGRRRRDRFAGQSVLCRLSIEDSQSVPLHVPLCQQRFDFRFSFH